MPKKLSPKLEKNVLVPFLGQPAERIKSIAEANGMPITVIVRLILLKGLETVENGNALTLSLPTRSGE